MKLSPRSKSCGCFPLGVLLAIMPSSVIWAQANPAQASATQTSSTSPAWLVAQSQSGDIPSEIALAKQLRAGFYGPRKPAEAMALLNQAALAGSTDAVAIMGDMYLHGEGVETNQSKGARLIQEATKAGSPMGVYLTGYLYETGEAGEKDLAKAVHFYGSAAFMNVPEANDKLGSIYLHGQGRMQNYTKAAASFAKGSRLGDRNATFHIGQMYESALLFTDPGDGTNHAQPDYQRAIDLYNAAADKGLRVADFRLAELYTSGPSDYRDEAKSLIHLERAAKRRYAPAEIKLANLKTQSGGPSGDLTGAYILLQDAIDQGYPQAEGAMNTLKRSMSASQQLDANRSYLLYKEQRDNNHE